MFTTLRLELPALPLGVQCARGAITRLCRQLRIRGAFADDIRLAVTEACTNCVRHAHAPDEQDAVFVLVASVEREMLLVVVEDSGEGFGQGPQSTLDSLGLGVALIALLADEIDIASRPHCGTRVSMRFALARREF